MWYFMLKVDAGLMGDETSDTSFVRRIFFFSCNLGEETRCNVAICDVLYCFKFPLSIITILRSVAVFNISVFRYFDTSAII